MLILSNKQCMLQYVKLHLTQINSIKSRTVYLNDDDDDDDKRFMMMSYLSIFIPWHLAVPMTSCFQMKHFVYNKLLCPCKWCSTTVHYFPIPSFSKLKATTLSFWKCAKSFGKKLMTHISLRLSVSPYHLWWESANVGQLIQLVQSPSLAGTGCRQSLPITRAILTVLF